MDSSSAISFHELEAISVPGQLMPVYRACPELVPHERMPRLVQRMFALFDGRRTLLEVSELVGIDLPTARAAADKLCALGVIRLVGGREDGFSALDEAFFASEVAPIDECNLSYPSLGDRVRRLLTRGRPI